MHYLLLALLVVVVLALGLRMFAHADVKALAKGIKLYGGGGLLAVAALFAVMGRFGWALPLGLIGFTLLRNQIPFGALNWPGQRQKSAGQASRVRTAMLEMELDHDTGAVDGRVLAGAFEDRTLSDLSLEELNQLYDACEDAGDQSAALLEAFLDRAHPEWREGAGGKRRKARGGGARAPRQPDMSPDEAYEVLGLASADEIRKAHRALIKKYHPDQGGSTYLAAQINKAKDTLLPND